MEKNTTKSNGLFQSVASTFARLFRRETPVAEPEPTSPQVSQPAEAEKTSPEVPEAQPRVSEAPAVSVVKEPIEEPRPEKTASPESVEKEREEPQAVAAEETPAEEPVEPQHNSQDPSATTLTRRPQTKDVEPQTPSDRFSLSSLSEKRKLHLADLTRAEAEMLLSEFVQTHISDDNLSVETMAAQLKVSRTSLYQLVREVYGVTPANYILDLRLKYAAELLHKGRKVRDVSTRCGFADPKYFSKVFRKYYGVLPSAFAENASALASAIEEENE